MGIKFRGRLGNFGLKMPMWGFFFENSNRIESWVSQGFHFLLAQLDYRRISIITASPTPPPKPAGRFLRHLTQILNSQLFQLVVQHIDDRSSRAVGGVGIGPGRDLGAGSFIFLQLHPVARFLTDDGWRSSFSLSLFLSSEEFHLHVSAWKEIQRRISRICRRHSFGLWQF